MVIGKLFVNLKTSCLDDPVCNFIKNHIAHHLSLSLQGELSPSSYSLSAKLLDVSSSFGDIWGLSQLEVAIKGTSEKKSGVYISGLIIHKETKSVGDCEYFKVCVKL